MWFLTASRPLPFGQRRRLNPVVRLLATAAGALVVIVGGLGVIGGVVVEAVADAPVVRSDKQIWYLPATATARAPAMTLDIARSVAVVPAGQPTSEEEVTFGHQVGVEALKVRAGPRPTASRLFLLKGGTPVKVGRTERGWVEISSEDGRSGWVWAKFITSTATVPY